MAFRGVDDGVCVYQFHAKCGRFIVTTSVYMDHGGRLHARRPQARCEPTDMSRLYHFCVEMSRVLCQYVKGAIV